MHAFKRNRYISLFLVVCCLKTFSRFLVALSLSERFGVFFFFGALVVVVAIVALIALDPLTVLITLVAPSLVL